MYDGPVIDAHIHQWDPRTTPRTVSPLVKLLGWNEWLMTKVLERVVPQTTRDFVGDPTHVLHAYLPDDWAADTDHADNVRGFVHIQADWQGRDEMDDVGETRWLEQVAGDRLLAIVARADLASPHLDAVLDAHQAASPRFRGIRDYLAHGGPGSRLVPFARSADRTAEPAWLDGYDRLGERGLTFDAWAYGPQLGRVADLVRAHPGTAVVIDHLGSPVGWAGPHAGHGDTPRERASILDVWREHMAAIAEAPQARVKLSGQAMTLSGLGWHHRDVPPPADEVAEAYAPLVSHALDVFGPQRCIVASNFPMDKIGVTWRAFYDAIDRLTAHLSDGERAALHHDNAAELYAIG